MAKLELLKFTRKKTDTDVFRQLCVNKKIESETDCWNWLLGRNRYGRIKFRGKYQLVHRLSAHFFLGLDLNSGLCVCHHCDNGLCFNPDHLFIGTQADNCLDKKQKGRSTFGEKNPSAKLTQNQVLDIRKMRHLSSCKLAKIFGVSDQAILDIWNRKKWGYLI